MPGWTNITPVNMTEDGSGDLRLNDGCLEGIATTTAKDHTTLVMRHCYAVVQVEEDPASTGEPKYEHEFRISEDAAVYSAWMLFSPGDYYCRAIQHRVTVHGDPVLLQRPKITRFSTREIPADSTCWAGSVYTTEVDSPAGALLGDRYLVGAVPTPLGAFNGHGDEIAICVEPTGPMWRFQACPDGCMLYHADEDAIKINDPSAGWVDADVRKISTGHITILAPSWDSKPAGTWAAWVDANQYMNGGYVNTSGGVGDSILYKTCLKKATYTMLFFHSTSATGGSIKIYKDAILAPNLLATINTFSGGTVYNVESRTTGIVLAVARLYDIIVVVDAAGAGGGKDCEFSYLAFWRTA